MVGMDTVRSLPEALGAEVWEMDMSLPKALKLLPEIQEK